MSEELKGPIGPSVKEQVEQLFTAADNSGKILDALFSVIVQKEDVLPAEPGEDLIKYDTDSERGKLQLDQDITAFQHQETLDAAGLKFERNVFGGTFCINDGEKFVRTLAAIPETSDTLKKGLNRIASGFLHRTSCRSVPDANKFNDDTFFKYRYAPQQQKNMDQADPTGEQAQMAAEVMLHADDIAAQLERLGIDKQALRNFDALRVAELENMLPEWAEAYQWGLFTPPREEDRSNVWRQWTDDVLWTAYFQFLDSCKQKAPANSKFMALIADGMNTNITKLRNGEIEAEYELERKRREERLQKRNANRTHEDDEIDAAFDSLDNEEWHLSQQKKWEKEYDRILAGVQLRLQPYLTARGSDN